MKFGIVDLDRETLLSTAHDKKQAERLLRDWHSCEPGRRLAVRKIVTYGSGWRFAQ